MRALIRVTSRHGVYVSVLILVSALILASAPVPAAIPRSSTGIIAWWPGHGNTRDIAGGHDGVVSGGVTYVAGEGHHRGFYFDGINGGIRVPDSPAFALGHSLTIRARVRIDSAAPGIPHQILFRGDDRPGLDPYYLAASAGGGGMAKIIFHIESASRAEEINAGVAIGRAVSLTATLDGDTGAMRLFIDGHIAAETTTPVRPLTELLASAHPGLGIGNTGNPGAVNEPFDGLIEDLRINSRAIPPEEIAASAAAEKQPESPPSSPTPSPKEPYRYWPRFPRPRSIITIKDVPSPEHQVMTQTLAGLVAQANLGGANLPMIWYPTVEPAYQRWFKMMLKQTGAALEAPQDLWGLVQSLQKRGVVKGYVLYHSENSSRAIYTDGPVDDSLNVATVLCSLYSGIAVSERLEPDAQRLGLRRIADARNITAADCFARYQKWLNRQLLTLQDPKVPENREEAVATRTFVLSRTGPLYEQALSWLQPDSPVLGWPIGDEKQVTEPSTLRGVFQTASNWCVNLPALSTESAGVSFPAEKLARPAPPSLWDLKWEDNVHYTCFIMSDGDNDQWLMGGFFISSPRSWWSSTDRGSVPIGWTFPYSELAQLCPYTLEYLFQTATPKDDFLLFGGGYYYPDEYGSLRPGSDALALHADRIGQYLHLGGLQLLMLNLQRPESQGAIDAYSAYARRMPGLKGIFTIQYDPYTGGNGAIRWVTDAQGDQVPVISTRFAIWNHTPIVRAAAPIQVAQWLNAMPHTGPPDTADFFSAVIIHAWSWFKQMPLNSPPGSDEADQSGNEPGTGGGMAAAKWCAERLAPHVRVVTPTELMWLVRLRLHPAPTLQEGLSDLATRLATDKTRPGADVAALTGAAASLKQAHQALAKQQFQDSFEKGKEADTALKALESAPVARVPAHTQTPTHP